MYIHQYPKKILYYTERADFFDDQAHNLALQEGNHWKNSGKIGVNQIVTDPNGVIITQSASGGFTATVLAAWPNTGTFSYGHATTAYGSTTLGRGGKFKVIGDFEWERNVNYGKLAWPSERHTDEYGNTGTHLANGYFTGPPTYRTTGSKWAFKIKNKTSLEWNNYVTDITIVVSGPHTSQKSKPEHFLWVAGGTGNGVALEVGMCFYDFRADFDNSYGRYIGNEHPNYRKLFNSVKLSMDSSAEEYVLSGRNYANVFSNFQTKGRTTSEKYLAISTYSHKELKKVPATETVGFVHAIYKSTNTTRWSITNDEYDDDDEPWPIIDTEKTVGGKLVWTTTFAKGPFNAGGSNRPVYTAIQDDDGSYYLTTSLGRHDVGWGHTAQSQQGVSVSYSDSLGRLRYTGRSMRGGTDLRGNDYYLTEYQQFGFIKRKHETSKRGYYFTDPDSVYKCATEVGTDFDVNTFHCHDATCIDIKNYANAQIFQTAKTYNNSLALATLKNPRNTSRAMSDTISLESVQGYSTYQTEETRIWDTRYNSAPIWGHPKYKKNEYGEDASYTYSGFETTEVDQTATRFIPVANTSPANNFFGGYYWYATPAYKWFYNPYQNPNRI